MRRAESAGFVVEQFDEGLVALLDFLAAPARSDLIEPLAIQIIRPGVVVIWMVEIGMGLRMVDQLVARRDQCAVRIGETTHPLTNTSKTGHDVVAL